jgi:hypothetical protein
MGLGHMRSPALAQSNAKYFRSKIVECKYFRTVELRLWLTQHIKKNNQSINQSKIFGKQSNPKCFAFAVESQNILDSTAHRPVDAPQRETEVEKIQNLFASNFSQMQNILDFD